MTPTNADTSAPDKYDILLALCIGVLALVIYTRVLAPDVLYGDSGEFQTLAYTWGTTHTTGYPVYLILARVVGLIPMGIPAWRISFASAIAAAVTLGGIYLITRYLTGRGGALLASIVLLLSYTFWSQSIIAEVYTMALAFIVIVLNLLLLWRAQPSTRRRLVFIAGFLVGVGPGVHLFVVLISPSVFLFVLWGAIEERHPQHLLRLMAGAVTGFIVFYGLFVLIDTRPTPTNIFTASIYPSREVWSLQDTDLDTEPERFWISVSGYQWRSAMLPANADYRKTLNVFFRENLPREYSTAAVLLAIPGVLVALIWRRRQAALMGIALLTGFAAGLVYFPGDKYIFYLPVYLLLAVFIGAGAGSLIALITRFTPKVIPRTVPAVIMTIILVVVCAAPLFRTRWRSIEIGRSGFITEDYVYPVTRADEPRKKAECALSKVAESDAMLVLDWRAMYSIYYVAQVEQGRTGILIRQANPYPAQVIAPHLLDEITAWLANGGVVYSDSADYPPLRQMFTLTPVKGACLSYNLFKLSPRG